MITCLKPAAGTQTLFVDAETNMFVSNLFICAETSGAVDVHVTPAGGSAKFAVYSGLYIQKNDTFTCTALKLAPGDKLYVTSVNGGHTFTMFSDEV